MCHVIYRYLVLLIASLSLAGCAGITYHAQPPQVSITDIRLVEAQLLEQQYKMTLRVQNPNDFPFFIKGLSYQLSINGSEFAHGVSKQSHNILPYDEVLLSVSMVSNTLNVIKQLQAASAANNTLHFRLKGTVSHGTINIPASLYHLPFEKEGTLDLSSFIN